MFDVFYFGRKPNLFPHEKYADSMASANNQAKTTYFWYIYGGNDYSEFDFGFESPPWESTHTHIWPNQFMPNGEVYLVPKNNCMSIPHYHTEQRVQRLDHSGVWKKRGKLHYLSLVDGDDPIFSWKPPKKSKDESPKIYVFGSEHNIPEIDPVAAYVESDDATDVIFVKDAVISLQPCTKHYTVLEKNIPFDFDYSWRPNPYAPPASVYFGSKDYPSYLKSFLVYNNTGSETTVKDHNYSTFVTVKQDKSKFEKCYENINVDFDYSWLPHPYDMEKYVFVFGCENYAPETLPLLKYSYDGNYDKPIKYVHDVFVKVVKTENQWQVINENIKFNFDYSWIPQSHDIEKYVFVFGCSQYSPETSPLLKYSYDGNYDKPIKYVHDVFVKVVKNEDQWQVVDPAIKFNFDYSWLPHPFDMEKYVFVFGCENYAPETLPLLKYSYDGNYDKPIKYVHDVFVKVVKNENQWQTINENIKFNFDYSWLPHPYDMEKYVFVFGCENYSPETLPLLKYSYDGNYDKPIKYVHDVFVKVVKNEDQWQVVDPAIKFNFDYSYIPHPHEIDKFVYVFGSKHYSPELKPILKYSYDGNFDKPIKYVHDVFVTVNKNSDCWQVVNTEYDFDFDYSWLPHPHETEPYIYVFGTKQYPAEIRPMLEYVVPGATEKKYMAEPTVTIIPDKSRWKVSSTIDVELDFDFEWLPHPHETEPYIYVFGNQHWSGDRSATIEYVMPNATQKKYVSDVVAKLETLDIFYVDKHNPQSEEHYNQLKEKYNNIQKVRFVNSMYDTVQRCAKKAKTPRFWVISSEYDYSNFDFEWQPDPWQYNMIHVFPNKWNKFSDTYLISKSELQRCDWVKNIKDYPTLNFVTNQSVDMYQPLNEIYYVDFNNSESAEQYTKLKELYTDVYRVRYSGSMTDVLRRIAGAARIDETSGTDFVWVISSICDYANFDFKWRPEPWQSELIHVFSSGLNKKGETFYVPLKIFNEQYNEHKDLNNFTAIHYNSDQRVKKYAIPEIEYNGDKLFEQVNNIVFESPYMLFKQENTVVPDYVDNLCFWDNKSRAIHTLDIQGSGSTVLIPRDVSAYLKKQLYDYPYIVSQPVEHRVDTNRPLDIVFLSNGEPLAEMLLGKLKKVIQDRGLKNKLHVVSNVNGRLQAYHAAAKASSTPWFFAVFAKLDIDENFDFDWQPDYLQENKHYIFSAKNVINGLEYGHQAMIAYNVDLLLNTLTPGLDVTQSVAHEYVPIHSGVAVYNQNEFMTWRTAFREVLKLKYSLDNDYAIETEYRLKKWLTCNSNVEYGEYSVRGANEALEYYSSVNGDVNELFNSFEWSWLKSKFAK